jgi:hypothetical protein
VRRIKEWSINWAWFIGFTFLFLLCEEKRLL